MINGMKNWKDRLSFVLVEPYESGNIGATTRAMKNMGFSKMEMVNPPELNEEAARFAHNSMDVLKATVSYPTLDEAMADKSIVIGVTRRTGKGRGHWLTIEEAAQKCMEMSPENKAALLFGREQRGLFNEEIWKCNYLITIPSAPEHPSLNLSHAVAVVAYEFHKAELNAKGEIQQKPKLAVQRELMKLYDRMYDMLVLLGYTKWGDREIGKNIINAIKAFLNRAELKERDVRILNGVCGRIESKLKEKAPDKD